MASIIVARHPGRPSTFRQLLCAAGLGLAVTLGLLPAGCGLFSREPHVSVPMQQSAAAQYRFAVQYREQRNLPVIVDDKKFLMAREVVRENFRKVIEYFPEDKKFNPLARLEIIDMDGGLDSNRVKADRGALKSTIAELVDLAKEYPAYEYIQAKSLFDQGLCYKRLNEFDRAQACFRQLRDRYTGHKDPVIADLAQRAAQAYNKTYVNEKQ